MKVLAALFLLLPVTAQAAQVCVERSEDDGSANIYSVDIMLGRQKLFTLLGGTNACADVKVAAGAVWARWHAFDWSRPDHGIYNKRMRHSSYTVLVVLKGEQRVDLKVCSKRAQGEALIWHVGGDGLGDCP